MSDEALAAKLARLGEKYKGVNESRFATPAPPSPPPEGAFIDLVFDGDRFVEIRDARGARTEYGNWLDTEHGRALRLPLRAELPDVKKNQRGAFHANGQPTERTAAELQRVNSGTKRAQVLGCFITDHRNGGDGLMDEDLAERFGIYRDTAGPRRLELVNMGYLRASGRQRRTSRNTPSIVWELTDAAITKLGLNPRRT